MRPIFRVIDETMLYWIIMNIIEMRLKIFIIPYHMFPKTSLPDITLSAV